MKNNKIKILVASHKPGEVFKDMVYTPIHVGRVLTGQIPGMENIIGDDTGENISCKNKSFCELTAIYWAWKNLTEVEYIGLAHYRRYFETRFTIENVDKIFKSCDVILARPYMCRQNLEIKLSRVLTMEDEIILLKVIKNLYPEYEKTVIDYLYDFVDIPYNMFVMKSSLFNKYSIFLFSILFECEKYMHEIPYSCSARRMGYIGEYLLPFFCIHNNLRIRYEYVVPFVGIKHTKEKFSVNGIKRGIKRLLNRRYRPSCIEEMFDHSILLGMRTDGIEI